MRTRALAFVHANVYACFECSKPMCAFVYCLRFDNVNCIRSVYKWAQ